MEMSANRLSTLRSKMKCDPEGYETEVDLIYSQFKHSVDLFKQQAALHFTSVASGGVGCDPNVAKDLEGRAILLAHVTRFYPNKLLAYPNQLMEFLRSSARVLPSSLRVKITEALILLINHKIVAVKEVLALFMELQVLSDKVLKKLAFTHVIHTIRRMNQKHRNESENRELQRILFSMLQEEDEKKAMRSLVTICHLHRRKVWFDDSTANAICQACFHSSSRIMIAALSFLLHYEKIDDNDDDDDASSDEVLHQPHVVVSKEAIYKAKNTGTTSSKKKKKAKLQRVIRSMKRQQRISSSEHEYNSNYHSPLNSLRDPQEFAEKLFSRFKTHLRVEIKMMIMKVVARTVGLHRLILLDFYSYIEKYCKPAIPNVTNYLAAVVQACHDMVPPDAVEPLFKKIVNGFVHDGARTEVLTVGLNVVREMCLRIPLLMTEDLLQDLVLYKKSHEKAVSSAARSLISLFREICPSLLVKKDRGRPIDPKAKPKAFGEITVPSDVPGADLLGDDEDNDDVSNASDDDEMVDQVLEDEDDCRGQKRKFVDLSQSLRALKRLAGSKLEMEDGILSNEDFQRIKELKAKKEAKVALFRHGLLKKASDTAFKIPTCDQLSLKRVDGFTLEANIRQKMTKEERNALIKAGREETGKYQARAATKQKKTGGLSNRQKEHKKAMPLAAKRSKVERCRRQKKMKQKTSGKQFRGRKAWK